MKYLLLTVVVVCAISFSNAGQDIAVCQAGDKKPTRPDKPFPQMPETFHSHIHLNSKANKTRKSFFEVFDAPNNRAIIMETISMKVLANISVSLTGRDIYNFNSNQVVEIIDNAGATASCSASSLDDKRVDTFIFGDKVSSKTGFTAKTAFMINDDIPPAYQGSQTLDNGILVDIWWDCHYITALDATVTAEWYFTDPSWNNSLGATQVPVMLKIWGKSYAFNNPQGRMIDHSYTFSDYGDFITQREADHFMIPQGTVCPYLKNFDIGPVQAHNIPPIASNGYFKFKAELIQKSSVTLRLVTDISEFYDRNLFLSRFDYQPQGLITTLSQHNSNNPIREIHDFRSGLAYLVDVQHGNCTIRSLADGAKFDVKTIDANHVRMKTVNEFFGLGKGTQGSSMNWTYTGRRKLRDIDADIYIAEILGYPPGIAADIKSVWELAITSKDYLEVATTATEADVQEPMRLWIYIKDYNKTDNIDNSLEMTYNIFNFNKEEPDTFTFDVSTCYSDDQKTTVHFKLPADKKDLMEKNKLEFKYWLLVTITGYLEISPTRVVNVEWTYDGSKYIVVEFQILDPPDFGGKAQSSMPVTYLNPTAEAYKLLQTAIDGGNFEVPFGSIEDDTITPVVAIKKSLGKGQLITNTKIQLDAGAAAGIGIGMVVAGIGIGVLIVFLINKWRDGAVPNLSLSFTPKTFKNES